MAEGSSDYVSATIRNRIGLGLLGAASAFLVGAIIFAKLREGKTAADPNNGQQVARGKVAYDQNCAACHGADGRNFAGAAVGKVEPIEKIRTDPCRLDNYTYALAVEQGNLYAGFPQERFTRFRKTNGYANMPLDGIWLRAPYLHNGSVPTVRDLLEPAEKRPRRFIAAMT